MQDKFTKYLVEMGYKEMTPSGNPSTVYDYVKRINRVCENEGISWNELTKSICTILPQYDIGGVKEELGSKSHNAVINALRRFEEFVSKYYN